MNTLKEFELVLKGTLGVISWEITEEQIINIARAIQSSKNELTRLELGVILQKNGITELSVLGLEGLDFSNMMALLKAAQDAVNKDNE